MKITLMLALLFIISAVQNTRDAATFITTAQINQLLSCNVKDGVSKLSGKYCSRWSADNKTGVIVQFNDFHTPNDGAMMIKNAFENSAKMVKDGQKASGFYTEVTPFAEGGTSAFIMTAPGTEFSPGYNTRTNFLLGSCMVTVDTRGIDRSKVIPKLGEIYRIIKGNFK